jgi:D-glycerate 3-kinase
MNDDFRIDFMRRHRLPSAFADTIDSCYAAVSDWLPGVRRDRTAALVGISGAQGTGKSTLAAFLAEAGRREAGLRVIALSLDDFYLTRETRSRLARDVHPLLATRGVPGTHDVGWLAACLDALAVSDEGRSVRLPVFDKGTDDRAPESAWRRVEGPVDVILLEGWCIGARPQPPEVLRKPVNDLERDEDDDGRWRCWVNERLATDYRALFERLDRLVFLQAPDMDCVYRWRLEQEEKITGARTAAMTASELRAFVGHYERITRQCLSDLPRLADVLLELDRDHRCRRVRFRAATTGAGSPGDRPGRGC